MKKPWIGIPTRYREQTEDIGLIRHYFDAVLWAGGLPLMIPSACDRELIREYVERTDGVLLPGSPTDIDPIRYGSQRHPKLGRIYPEREATDFALLEFAEELDLPLLGICFGAQSLNVYRGGSLVQDIPCEVPHAIAHNGVRHVVRFTQDSLLGCLAGKAGLAGPALADVEIASDHHQCIQTLGRNLRAAAFAPDGLVEAVEDNSGRFIIGVQWHPERGWRDDQFSQALFSALIEQARYNNPISRISR